MVADEACSDVAFVGPPYPQRKDKIHIDDGRDSVGRNHVADNQLPCFSTDTYAAVGPLERLLGRKAGHKSKTDRRAQVGSWRQVAHPSTFWQSPPPPLPSPGGRKRWEEGAFSVWGLYAGTPPEGHPWLGRKAGTAKFARGIIVSDSSEVAPICFFVAFIACLSPTIYIFIYQIDSQPFTL